ncbi:MAG TPA: hypothetical protein VN259_04570 [Xanthomonadales bacterium]|nr:hypothetical protein [Xanthomonadales bacterium]
MREHNVHHLWEAPSLRRHTTYLERAATMLNHKPQDQILLLDLPLIAGQPPSPVLVLLVRRDQQSSTVLLDDEGEALTRTLLGQDIPAFYNPRPFGSMRELFASDPQASTAVFAEGGLQASSLCAARAVALMLEEPGLSAKQALERAREIGQACAAMVVRQSALAAQIRAG